MPKAKNKCISCKSAGNTFPYKKGIPNYCFARKEVMAIDNFTNKCIQYRRKIAPHLKG